MDTLSKRLSHVRDASGLRHQDLASLARCSVAQIGHLCTGLRDDPATSYLDGIAAGLDIDLDWLAGGRGEEPTADHLRAVGERFRDDLAAANATPAPADVAEHPGAAA
jgi:transcriptional regulator with XRE-family HTH domain